MKTDWKSMKIRWKSMNTKWKSVEIKWKSQTIQSKSIEIHWNEIHWIPAQSLEFTKIMVSHWNPRNSLETHGVPMESTKPRRQDETLQKRRILVQKGVILDPLQPGPFTFCPNHFLFEQKNRSHIPKWGFHFPYEVMITRITIVLLSEKSFYIRKVLSFDSKDNTNWTCLLRASQENFHDVARLLLDHGADIETRNAKGWTPLHAAA